MLISERQRSWLERRRTGLAHPVMHFIEDRLELGAGTIMARMAGDPWHGRGLDLDGREARIIALLAAAYRRPISLGVLDHLRRAGCEWGRGEACLAQIHLAFSGLPRLSDPEDAAYRLFMAQGLMDDGVAPRDILRALDIDPTPLDHLDKAYYDTEPRVPPGSGRPSGRWTDGAAGAGTTATTSIATVGATVAVASGRLAGSFLSREISGTTLAALSEFASAATVGAVGAVAALGLVFIPSPGGSSVSKGELPGRKDLSYHWDEEAGRLVLSTQIADAKMPVVDAHVGSDGIYYDRDQKPVARVLDGRLVVESRALPRPSVMPDSVWSEGHDDTESDENSLTVPLEAATTHDDPRLCPDPGPDVPHGASERAKAYQERITGLPRGLAVELNGVVFDGCREADGTMIEAKGLGFAQFLDGDGNWYEWARQPGKIGWQLWRQSLAVGDRRIEWHVAEERAAVAITAMVQELNIKNIDVIWDP